MKKSSINYCALDYKNHHRWEKVGVEKGMIIYQCVQCHKCSFEVIEMLGNLFSKVSR